MTCFLFNFLCASDVYFSSKLGDIPAEDVKKIRENAKVDVARAQEIEQETRHPNVSETCLVNATTS
jgi:adenylosuccinate lyase